MAQKCLGCPQLFELTADAFLEETDGMMVCLEEAIKAQDRGAIKEKAHWIKGGLVYLHARPSSEAAKKLEAATAVGPEAIDRAYRELQVEISKLKEALQNRGLPAGNAPSSTSPG